MNKTITPVIFMSSLVLPLIKELAEEMGINPPLATLERLAAWYEKRSRFSSYTRDNTREILQKKLVTLNRFRDRYYQETFLKKLESWVFCLLPKSIKRYAPDCLASLQCEAWGRFQIESRINQCRGSWEVAEWWEFFSCYPRRKLKTTGKTILQTRVYDWVKRQREYPSEIKDYQLFHDPTEENFEQLDWWLVRNIFTNYLKQNNQEQCAQYIEAYIDGGADHRYIEKSLGLSVTQRDYLQQKVRYWVEKFLTDAREIPKVEGLLSVSLPPEARELVNLGKYKEATKLIRKRA